MQPFNPQTLEEMRARYKQALTPLFDYVGGQMTKVDEEMVPGDCFLKTGPGPAHVFDYPNGMRIIITRDREESGIYLHMSVGLFPGTELWDNLVGTGEVGQRLIRMAADTRYLDLSGDTEPLEFNGFSERGIGHWRRLET